MKTILIIEDDIDLREGISFSLQSEGYQILTAEKLEDGWKSILKENPDTCVRIPMIGETRSLNLSNSVAIVLYEALRQNQFDHMKLEGQLHRLSWDD